MRRSTISTSTSMHKMHIKRLAMDLSQPKGHTAHIHRNPRITERIRIQSTIRHRHRKVRQRRPTPRHDSRHRTHQTSNRNGSDSRLRKNFDPSNACAGTDTVAIMAQILLQTSIDLLRLEHHKAYYPDAVALCGRNKSNSRETVKPHDH